MGKITGNKAYQISDSDNVATALTELQPGTVWIQGSEQKTEMTAKEMIPAGHKISLKMIEKGEKIIKYGVPIGEATCRIPQGIWVHLHNIKSLYDSRSQKMDVRTGAPTDTKYE